MSSSLPPFLEPPVLWEELSTLFFPPQGWQEFLPGGHSPFVSLFVQQWILERKVQSVLFPFPSFSVTPTMRRKRNLVYAPFFFSLLSSARSRIGSSNGDSSPFSLYRFSEKGISSLPLPSLLLYGSIPCVEQNLPILLFLFFLRGACRDHGKSTPFPSPFFPDHVSLRTTLTLFPSFLQQRGARQFLFLFFLSD